MKLNNQDMPEILAPVGGKEQLIAAVRSGADAVYLGTKQLNARRNAQNFGDDTLRDVVSYCHARNVAVHVTVNTLVRDSEMREAEKLVGVLAESGADAVIIQDLGINAMFAQMCPDIHRHASTQLTIHNLDGALAAKDLGFSRVVLARELSLKEIENIAAHCGIETEVFVHGALCMSFSGSCYMSAVIGQRSGNRGLCAQPCRTDVRCGGKEYVLSLKDLSYLDHLKELSDAGVCSFKIEGRMKRPEYVSATVAACRSALRGEPYDRQLLQDVFSRDGFTDGYLYGKIDKNMFGRRHPEDAERSRAVLSSITGNYREEFRSVPVSFSFTASGGKKTALKAFDGVHSSESLGAVPETAQRRDTSAEDIAVQLLKTGGTPFIGRIESCDVEPGLYIPIFEINRMRRETLDDILAQRSVVRPHPLYPYSYPAGSDKHSVTSHRIYGFFEDPEIIPQDPSFFDAIIVPFEKLCRTDLKGAPKIIAGIPQILLDTDEDSDRTARLIRDAGIDTVYAENHYGLKFAEKHGFTVIGGARLNVFNSGALSAVVDLGVREQVLSFELDLNSAEKLNRVIPCGVISYGRLPLMTVRNCPGKAAGKCSGCSGSTQITDRTGTQFPVLCRNRRFSTIYNSVPLYMADKDLSGFDFELMIFTDENAGECADIIHRYRDKLPAGDIKFTRGLYYRPVE